MKTERQYDWSMAVCAMTLLATCGLSQAATMVWEDTHSGSPLDFLHEKWGSNDSSHDRTYSKTWNITNAGFNPGVDAISGIEVWFAFADDQPGFFDGGEIWGLGDAEERVDISLGGSMIWDDLEVDGRHGSANYAYYSMVLDPLTHLSVFSDLAADGKLKYTVALQELLSDSGSQYFNREDVYFKGAKLRATYDVPADDSGQPQGKVPDGGTTLALLGAGLAGLYGIRRKLS